MLPQHQFSIAVQAILATLAQVLLVLQADLKLLENRAEQRQILPDRDEVYACRKRTRLGQPREFDGRVGGPQFRAGLFAEAEEEVVNVRRAHRLPISTSTS